MGFNVEILFFSSQEQVIKVENLQEQFIYVMEEYFLQVFRKWLNDNMLYGMRFVFVEFL
jgi:hypothetical protein